jgi:pimeloyl-ACP methyl ester carboxylesterase
MRVVSSNGVDVAVHDLGGEGPVLLISHATGFHGRSYEPLARASAHRFHSIGFDYRGHGDTPSPVRVPTDAQRTAIDWQRYGDDAQAVATSIRDRAGGPITAFGHSMGGACLLMAAHRDPSLFDRLVLFEPIVYPPADSLEPPPENTLSSGARRRRSTFPSFEAAIESFASRPPLGAFTPDALDAYVRHGFALRDDGQVHLKCEPETEARTYEGATLHNTWQLLPEIDIPVTVSAGRLTDGQPSMIASDVAARLPRGTYVQLDELDHFGPMSHPEVVAALVESGSSPN